MFRFRTNHGHRLGEVFISWVGFIVHRFCFLGTDVNRTLLKNLTYTIVHSINILMQLRSSYLFNNRILLLLLLLSALVTQDLLLALRRHYVFLRLRTDFVAVGDHHHSGFLSSINLRLFFSSLLIAFLTLLTTLTLLLSRKRLSPTLDDVIILHRLLLASWVLEGLDLGIN